MSESITLRNVSPLGDLDVPILRRIVEAGEEFEVPASIAGCAPVAATDQDPGHPGEGLLGQADNFKIVEPTKGAKK